MHQGPSYSSQNDFFVLSSFFIFDAAKIYISFLNSLIERMRIIHHLQGIVINLKFRNTGSTSDSIDTILLKSAKQTTLIPKLRIRLSFLNDTNAFCRLIY